MVELRAERYRSGRNGPASKAGWGLNSPTGVRIPPSPPSLVPSERNALPKSRIARGLQSRGARAGRGRRGGASGPKGGPEAIVGPGVDGRKGTRGAGHLAD